MWGGENENILLNNFCMFSSKILQVLKRKLGTEKEKKQKTTD